MLDKIINRLFLTEPFFGYLLLKLKVIENTNISTMRTNGIRLEYAPAFVKSLTDEHVTGVLIHELMHCVFKHPIRGMGHIMEISQYAADYVINDYIQNQTDFELPQPYLYSDRFQNMSYEEVYKILCDECDEQPNPDLSKVSEELGEFEPNDGDVLVDEEDDSGVSLDDYWDTNVQEAANVVKQVTKGGLTPAAELIIKSVKPAQLPWERLLFRFVDANVRNVTSWKRPNRRFIAQGIYLPSKYSDSLESLLVAIDSSCSVNELQFEHMTAEINKILLKVKPKKLTVMQCDSIVQRVETFQPADYPIQMSITGRGWTQFNPVFEYIEEQQLHPNCMVYFTDLEGDFDFPVPRYPVLWINTSPSNELVAPFGETIRIKI